jgi:monothiol glutaredoxin
VSRPELNSPSVTPIAANKMAAFNSEFVDKVRDAVSTNDIVVVGMAWNPSCGRACKRLEAEGLKHIYIEEGNYLWGWKRRLGVKLWSGWPTFPQVFVKGTLVGGGNDMAKQLADGTIQSLLSTESDA